MSTPAADVAALAELARLEAERHPPRSYARKAASHLWIAAAIPPAASLAAVRRAVESFGEAGTQAAALALLERLRSAAAQPATGQEST